MAPKKPLTLNEQLALLDNPAPAGFYPLNIATSPGS